MRIVFAASLVATFACMCAAETAGRSPQATLRRACTKCHRLDVVQAQRLSREEWDRELDKMTRMGARIPDRPALLDYLVRKYGPDDQSR